jgi:hypothetical protein
MKITLSLEELRAALADMYEAGSTGCRDLKESAVEDKLDSLVQELPKKPKKETWPGNLPRDWSLGPSSTGRYYPNPFHPTTSIPSGGPSGSVAFVTTSGTTATNSI